MDRLDFYGRKKKKSKQGSPRENLTTIKTGMIEANQESISLEIRSQLDMAKEEMNVYQKEVENDLLKKSLQLGLLDDKRLFKSSQITEFDEENLKRMQAKMEVFEEETF